ncbi:hypothetical protein [Kamptonema formosum]|uniref:hypothetical protein n=1 Tax=Kamptonema formosum TaxID=331992 RepID=UPI0003484C0A|nr:hypothetical protein [Oscillatoria sp. PCC 10802]
MKSNKIERNSNATAAGAEGDDVVRDQNSLSDGELESIVGGATTPAAPAASTASTLTLVGGLASVGVDGALVGEIQRQLSHFISVFYVV